MDLYWIEFCLKIDIQYGEFKVKKCIIYVNLYLICFYFLKFYDVY